MIKQLPEYEYDNCSLEQNAHAPLWMLGNTPSIRRIDKWMLLYYTRSLQAQFQHCNLMMLTMML